MAETKKTHKITITMVETRTLQKEFEVSDEEYNTLNGDGDLDSECLNEMFSDIVDSKYASTEYDYAVYDQDIDKEIVSFYE